MLNARRMRAAVIPRGLAASVLAALALTGITVTAAAASHPADSLFGHAVTCRNGIGDPVALAPGQVGHLPPLRAPLPSASVTVAGRAFAAAALTGRAGSRGRRFGGDGEAFPQPPGKPTLISSGEDLTV